MEVVRTLDSMRREYERNNKENDSQYRRTAIREWVGIGVIILAFGATIWQTRISQRQLDEMKAATAVARQATVAVQRAFITVSYPVIEDMLNKKGALIGWSLSPEIKNSGITPTKNLRGGWVLEEIYGDDLDESFLPIEDPALIPTDKARRAFLGPQQVLTTYGDWRINRSDLEDADLAWIIRGALSYNDVFPDTPNHITKFCYLITPRFTSKHEIIPVVERCDHWNCADEECDAEQYEYMREFAKDAKERAIFNHGSPP